MPTPSHRHEAPGVWSRRVVFALHAATVVGLALWVRTLAPAAGIAATLLLAAIGIGAVRERRRVDVVAFICLAIAAATIVALNGRALHSAEMATDSPELISEPIERDLADAITNAQRQLFAAATSASGGTSVRAAIPDLPSETGLIVFVGKDSAYWAGRTVVPAVRLWERAGIVVTPFYVVQYAAVLNRDRRAVAMSVVHARPPADRLARALTTGFGGSPAVRFDVVDVTLERGSTPKGTLVDIGGARLAVRASVSDAAAYSAGVEQSARTHAAAILLLATIASLAVLLRNAERLGDRIAAVAIPMVAIAITPLNALSNVTRLFDASTYYVEGGGPYTASVGALAMASALVLFVVMASVRVRTRPRRRWGALIAVLVVAGAAPYLLRYLARGINLPPSGPTTPLWIAWEVALFLAATSFLTAGVGAGQGALGAKRGLPLWVAPVLATVAALLGPALLGNDGTWPQWYPVLWVAAIGALVLARRSRAVLLSSAFVAACGATVLLWGATVRERVRLAGRDVARLGMTEAETYTLLDRLASDASQVAPPTTRAQLLALFASADIAATDFPVALAYWPIDSTPTFHSVRGGGKRTQVARLVADARLSNAAVTRALPSNPAAAVALAVPYSTGGVFTAVVESRARLSRVQSFPDLTGLWEETPNPPYQLTLAPPSAPDTTEWSRLGTHLHREITLASSDGPPVRVRADVTFDPYETLVPVGLLIVLLDLVIVGVLFSADLFAGGVLGRWIRMRRSRWRRSYRLQLTFALFAFFIVPALAFAFWSYRRLHADDRESRELLVREALRRAYVITGTDTVKEIPPDIPHFIYHNGQLVSVSDSLLLSVAPTGQWLEPKVQRLLNESDEIVATTPIRVGKTELLFGYRSLSKDLVAAVPARNDEASITKRRSDLGVLVVLATVLGAFAALGLSGVAARNLARPIGALRAAALAVAGGSREPLGSTDAPAEFVPVFRAFDRMARDLAASEAQLTRAERVLAWGEMARQVAHEIKNPLTPIRLGVQHLLRAWRDGRPDFDKILEENSARLLREIDHLDATARSFGRFGTMPDAPAPAEIIDAAAVVRDVVSLESLGVDSIEWRVSGADEACTARARAHELREVLINLCENARNASARLVDIRLEKRDGRISLSVVDDGEGVPTKLHARVFEPHFSTRTSGSGLGLAISRQLVESWGGSIDLYSEPGIGTTVRIILRNT